MNITELVPLDYTDIHTDIHSFAASIYIPSPSVSAECFEHKDLHIGCCLRIDAQIRHDV